MDVRLRVLEGANAGQEILIPVKKFFIGRSEDCHLRPHSDLISRHHCVILIDESRVSVRELASKNGTFVNAERVAGERALRSGDRLTVGPLKFEVLLSTSVGGPKRPAVRDVREAVARTAEGPQGTAMRIDEWLGEDQLPPVASSDTGKVTTSDTSHVATANTQTLTDLPPLEPSPTSAISASSADTLAFSVAPPPPANLQGPHTPIPSRPTTPEVAGPAAQSPAPAPAAEPPTQPVVPPAAASPPSVPRYAGYGSLIEPSKEESPAQPKKQDPARPGPSMYVLPAAEEPAAETGSATETGSEAKGSETDPAKQPPGSRTGKLPKSAAATNSREAAADTLRRLFGRR